MTLNPDKPESKPESKPTPNADKPASKPESKPSPKDDKNDLKSLPMPELMKKLGASADGLTQAEAKKRQAQYGPNEIAEKKTNEYLKFLSYFWGPIPWMIEAAVILSGVVRHWLDFFVILVLLCPTPWLDFGKNIRQEMPLPPSKPVWRSRPRSSEMASGRSQGQ